MGNKNKEFWHDPKFLAEITRKMPGYVYWKDTNGLIIGCNDKYAVMLDRKDVNEIIGKTDEELDWDPDLLKKIILEDKEVMDSQKSLVSEDWAYLMGKDRCFRTEKRPLLHNEEVVGLLCITIDITAEKEAARQLMQALKVTAASISHEMKTPLAGIKNLLDSLLKAAEKLNEGYQKAEQEKLIAKEEGEPIYDKIKSLNKQALRRIDAANTMISMQIENMSIDKIDARFFEQLSMGHVVEQALKKYVLDKDERALLHW
ncbi:MAG: PAS domain-containing protein, partial [Gammaproteobacteria bacterium]